MPYSTAIKRHTNSIQSVLSLAGSLWLHGHDVAFSKVNGLFLNRKPGCQAQHYKVLHNLHPYRWHYEGLLWTEPRSSLEFRKRRYPRHELLGLPIPGGNGLDSMWRDVLRVADISWLQDNKLEETVVFPGAGYLAMAIEAVLQASGSSFNENPTFRLENVNILTALALSTEQSASVEIFTLLRRSPISYTSNSSNWWDFTSSTPRKMKYKVLAGFLKPSLPRMWYEKLIKEGLNFGPAFQSTHEFNVPRRRPLNYRNTKLPLLRACGDNWDWSLYAVHPITLDAMLQTAIVATSGGDSGNLHAKVPTKFDVVVIETPEPFTSLASINVRAESIRFGVAEIGVEPIDSSNRIVAYFDGVRLSPYEVISQVGTTEKRHPMLRVLWEADIYGLGLMLADHLSGYLDELNPGLRILELGNDINDITKATLDLLGSNTAFKRFSSYTMASFSDTANVYLKSRLDLITSLMKPEALLLIISSVKSRGLRNTDSMDVVECRLSDDAVQISLARVSDLSSMDALNGFCFIVLDRCTNELSGAIMEKLAKISGRPTSRFTLDEVTEDTITPGATIFCLIECSEPALSTSTNEEIERIKHITNRASNIVWVTGGNLLDGSRPEFALISGIARALAPEQPSLQFFTFDIDDIRSEVQQTAERLVSVLMQRADPLDKEFIQRQGVVQVSRLVPDKDLNSCFRQKQGTELMDMPLEDAQPFKLSIEKPKQFDSLCLKQIELPKTLGLTDVQIQIKTVGLNAEDFYVLAGKDNTLNSTCSLEFCGIVERVGTSVVTLSPGDHVVAMAPSPFQTSQIVPEWACQKLRDDEDFNILSRLPLVYTTVIYALHGRARIKRDETILIYSGAGGVGIAAIQLAMLAGAEVFTTVSTEAKKDYLVKTFRIKPSNIFSSRDTSFLPGILEATNGQGVDIVLNSLSGDLLHASWRCCGQFGRFVEIGKRDLTDAGRLEMDQSLKNATFTAFDLSPLYNTNSMILNQTWARLLREALWPYREKKIMKIDPLEVFDISNITQAFRYFSSRNRMRR
ncbi:hypothetical protein G7Y89_g578 [Cudoniella acicularis]|uniref:PKS/mFAS DH domain-containing protein n=1 Tax=Cudoniella acicularis TaxID=354080 RepID=A0A8H4RYK1_9HELO|nr:hypothetical protein G7Y89_g578 [Cudoniella acicularis]